MFVISGLIFQHMMKFLLVPLICVTWCSGSNNRFLPGRTPKFNDTTFFTFGNFTDDYGIKYSINDSLWTQLPLIKYHIIRWNKKEQYFVTRNDSENPTEPGLYTRIDYMPLNNMKPYLWGFCLTVYNAVSDSIAESAAAPDRKNPKKGCNGFPFSRMKKTE